MLLVEIHQKSVSRASILKNSNKKIADLEKELKILGGNVLENTEEFIIKKEEHANLRS